jgi:DNA-binding YbaB/EbfC family protein
MFGNLGNMMSLMGNMSKITKEYKSIMAGLKDKTVVGSAGGEQVQVTVNGTGDIIQIKIDPELVKTGDTGLIEELTLAAVNAGVAKSRELIQKEMGQLSELLPMDQLKGLLDKFQA